MSLIGEPNVRNHAAFIWSVADLLRGHYKQSEYAGRWAGAAVTQGADRA